MAPDGRFLMIELFRDQEPQVQHLVVIDNWLTELHGSSRGDRVAGRLVRAASPLSQ